MSLQTREGAALLRDGNTAAGRAMLMQALAAGEPAAPIWYAMALAADSADEKRIYLQKALEADPLHDDARRELALLAQPAPKHAGPAMRPVAGDSEEATASARALGKGVEKKSGAPLALVLVLLIVGACGFFSMVMGGGSSGSGGRAPAAYVADKYGAWDVCTQQVEKQLKAPSTAKFPSLSADDVVVTQDGKKFGIVGYVDAENGFGAMIHSDFICEATHQSGTTWNVRASLTS